MKFKELLLFGIFGVLVGCNDSESEGHNSTPEIIVQKDTSITIEIIEEVEEKIDTIWQNNFWDSVDVSSATLYAYIPETMREKYDNEILIEGNVLHPSVVKELTKELDVIYLEILKTQLTTEVTGFSDGSECFEPHHGIVMRDKNGNISGSLSICFMCNNYSLSPKYVGYLDLAVFKKMVLDMGVPVNRNKIFRINREGLPEKLEDPMSELKRIFETYNEYQESTDSEDNKSIMRQALEQLKKEEVSVEELDLIINIWMYYTVTDYPSQRLTEETLLAHKEKAVEAVKIRMETKLSWESEDGAPFSELNLLLKTLEGE